MISRPLVAGTLLGLTLGAPYEGLALGAGLELFFLGAVNIGASLPDNELFTTVGAVGCACALSEAAALPHSTSMAAAVLLALPAAKLGKSVDRLNESINGWAAAHAHSDSAGRVKSRLRYNLFGLWLPFVATALTLVAGTLVGGLGLPPLFEQGPAGLSRAFSVVWTAFLMVAAASALRSVRTLHAGLYAAGAAAVAFGTQAARMWAS